MNTKKLLSLGLVCCVSMLIAATGGGCDDQNSSDDIQRRQQEEILQEATAQTGMPAIKNFRERKMMKDILELRDQEGIVTYTYIVAENTGKLIYLGQTIGYGLPYATQYTAPDKPYTDNYHYGFSVPQADPNGLFSPAAAEGTWVLMKDPNGGPKVSPVYVEPRIIVSPFPLNVN
jgi:hypothetical protein